MLMKSLLFRISVFAGALLLSHCIQAQKQEKFRAVCVGFYNVENLFDTIDQPEVNDAEFTPAGSSAWNTFRYNEKLNNLATVIFGIATDITPDGLAVLGLSEIENRQVVEDLLKTAPLNKREYAIVHYDSPDRRGVDVGLIYQPKYYKVTNTASYRLTIKEMPDFLSRDQLLVSGYLDGEMVHFIVNHWPSRRGGEQASRPLRNAAADLNKHIIDSIMAIDPQAKIIVMGDLNDDPVNPSVRQHLKATGNREHATGNRMYNPMEELYRKGIGSLAYQDSWNLFDQIIVSPGLARHQGRGWYLHSALVYNKEFLRQKSGSFKGYPFRTYAGGVYMGGYSDHFPVYAILAKPE